MVIVRIWEGLGNQLFQYAYARALALRTGQKVYLDVSEYGKDNESVREYGLCHFRIRQPTINCGRFLPFTNMDKSYAVSSKYLKHFPIRFIKEEDCYFKSDLCELKGPAYLKGWFQSEDYFKEFAYSIREEIRPRKQIRITKEIRNILDRDDTVSVHIRRGDFKKDHNILSAEYYENAKQTISRLIGNPYYVVFSDDILWVKTNMDFGDMCFYVDGKCDFKDYEELMIMSRCTHNIIANSTFSWWGAWLNSNKNKVVIAPKKWFLGIAKKDTGIIPYDWIRL